MLSDKTRAALRLMGVPRELLCKVCRQCNRPSGSVNGDHPLDGEIRKVKKRLRTDPGNMDLDGRRHHLESIRYNTSRCCGARYIKVTFDAQEADWARWQNRFADVRQYVVPRILRQNPNLSGEEAMTAAIRFMRSEYGPMERGRDDDFIILSHLWARGDREIKNYVTIFKEEERLQNQSPPEALQPEVSALPFGG